MTEEQQHRMEIILEDMNGKFDLLLEGHAALDRKIDRVHAEATENHREAMSMIHTVHDSLKTEIDSVRSELKTDIGSVRNELKTEIASVRDELKADIHAVGEKVDGHEERITRLEKKVA